MIVERISYKWICDKCGDQSEEFDEDNEWREVKGLNKEGWRKVDDSCEIYCPECAPAMIGEESQAQYQTTIACPLLHEKKECELLNQCHGGFCRELYVAQTTAANLERNREKRYQRRLARTRELLWPNREAS